MGGAQQVRLVRDSPVHMEDSALTGVMKMIRKAYRIARMESTSRDVNGVAQNVAALLEAGGRSGTVMPGGQEEACVAGMGTTSGS